MMGHLLKKEEAFFLRNLGACFILKMLHAQGGRAYYVGGCVRGSVMGQSSASDDIDITTSLTPEEVMVVCDTQQIKYVPTGLAFGTVTLVMDGCGYEVTTMRQDIETNGRHAVVKFTTDYRQDALRRDFTINAIYCTLEGEVFSPVGGIEDALSRQVRFIGSPRHRITEDYLRILRYYRFIAHYGIPEDCGYVSAICGEQLRDMVRPSAERNIYELSKLVMLPFAVPSLELMKKYSILEAFFENKTYNIQELSDILELQKEFSVVIPAFLRIFILCGENILEQTKCFRFSRKELREIKQCIKIIQCLTHNATYSDMMAMRYDYEDTILRIALMIYCVKHHVSQEKKEKINVLFNISLPNFTITGHDIVAQGIRGQEVKQVLHKKRLEFLKKFIQENYFYLDIV